MQIRTIEHRGLQRLEVQRQFRQPPGQPVALRRDVPGDRVREQHERHGRHPRPGDRRRRVGGECQEAFERTVPDGRVWVADGVAPAAEVVSVDPRFVEQVGEGDVLRGHELEGECGQPAVRLG